MVLTNPEGAEYLLRKFGAASHDVLRSRVLAELNLNSLPEALNEIQDLYPVALGEFARGPDAHRALYRLGVDVLLQLVPLVERREHCSREGLALLVTCIDTFSKLVSHSKPIPLKRYGPVRVTMQRLDRILKNLAVPDEEPAEQYLLNLVMLELFPHFQDPTTTTPAYRFVRVEHVLNQARDMSATADEVVLQQVAILEEILIELQMCLAETGGVFDADMIALIELLERALGLIGSPVEHGGELTDRWEVVTGMLLHEQEAAVSSPHYPPARRALMRQVLLWLTDWTPQDEDADARLSILEQVVGGLEPPSPLG